MAKIMIKVMMVLIMIQIMTPNITRSSSDGLRRQKNIRRLMSERAEKKQQKMWPFQNIVIKIMMVSIMIKIMT